jgi:hypothetical protein
MREVVFIELLSSLLEQVLSSFRSRGAPFGSRENGFGRRESGEIPMRGRIESGRGNVNRNIFLNSP